MRLVRWLVQLAIRDRIAGLRPIDRWHTAGAVVRLPIPTAQPDMANHHGRLDGGQVRTLDLAQVADRIDP